MKGFPVSSIPFLSLALLTLPAHADWVHEKSDLEPDPAVTFGQLENGLRYAILPNSEPPNRISLRLFIDAGSMMETESQQGLAHFLEHMAFNGTRNYPPGEMIEYFQRLGMAFGSHTNAHTSFRETVYKLELPDTKPDMIDEGLQLMRDYADGMLLRPEEIDRERGVILAEKRDRDSPSWRSFVDWISFSFPEHRVSQRLPIGTEEVISGAPRQEFVDFYQRWYVPDRMVLIATGAVDAESLRPMIEAKFAGFDAPESPSPDPDYGKIPSRGLVAHHYHDDEAPDTTVSIETKRPFSFGSDSAARRERELITRLATDMVTRRLSILAKKEGSPIIEGSLHYRDLFDLALVDYASIDATCQADDWKEALALIERELRRALEHGFSEAELQEAKANFEAKIEAEARSAATRRSRALADQIASRIGSGRVFTHPETDLDRVRPALATLTPDACHAALRDIWGDGQEIAVYASGKVEVPGGGEEVLSVYRKSRETPVEAPEQLETAAFAYASRPEQPAYSQSHVQDLEIRQIQFANGVRANIKRTDFEDNTVYVTARIGLGKLIEPREQPGLSILASAAFEAGGLEAHTADELKRILAGRTVNTSFLVEDDAFVLSGRTQPDDLLLQLELLRAYITAPGYRSEGERQFDRGLDQIYSQLRHTPQGILSSKVERFLHSGDSRFGYPEQDSLLAFTLEDVRSWLDPVLDEGYLEVSIVGDVDPEAAGSALARTFGTLPSRAHQKPSALALRDVNFPEDRDERVFAFESEIAKSMALVYWPTDDMKDIRKTRRLGMLASVFRDRLRKKVREELGDAYSPYARNVASEALEDFGYFMALVEADPAQARKLVEVIRDIGAGLASEGVTEDELLRAKKPILTMIEEYRRTNGYWMNSVLSRSQEEPERLDWARSFVSDYESITVAELNELAKVHLAPEEALEVLILPK